MTHHELSVIRALFQVFLIESLVIVVHFGQDLAILEATVNAEAGVHCELSFAGFSYKWENRCLVKT